ncbi:hypothetical protein CTEN210_15780 [Chaetoceros tenuissimus]|uniref:Uncharacterized protein n=1 Tax=Chaetoceros tenuissimus TaxID=426638 RepID=A0AAD3D7M0_9STRA|nr:hypothetical protein CTEN210_15780 [Chaetoceros tenuissimus]
MKFFRYATFAMMASYAPFSGAFSVSSNKSSLSQKTTSSLSAMNDSDRRSFLSKSVASIAVGTVFGTSVVDPQVANAIPGVTVAEFETILKTSAKSVALVEFSGSKSENAVVTLIDSTKFIITDLFESSTDPRSPLKLIATCRSYGVPTKNVGLEEAVLSLSSSGSKKKKVYMNERVRKAAELEREKKERMEQDERDRLAELEKQQGL